MQFKRRRFIRKGFAYSDIFKARLQHSKALQPFRLISCLAMCEEYRGHESLAVKKLRKNSCLVLSIEINEPNVQWARDLKWAGVSLNGC